jgi:hypothetical protein
MNVTLPSGRIITDVPEDVTQSQIAARVPAAWLVAPNENTPVPVHDSVVNESFAPENRTLFGPQDYAATPNKNPGINFDKSGNPIPVGMNTTVENEARATGALASTPQDMMAKTAQFLQRGNRHVSPTVQNAEQLKPISADEIAANDATMFKPTESLPDVPVDQDDVRHIPLMMRGAASALANSGDNPFTMAGIPKPIAGIANQFTMKAIDSATDGLASSQVDGFKEANTAPTSTTQHVMAGLGSFAGFVLSPTTIASVGAPAAISALARVVGDSAIVDMAKIVASQSTGLGLALTAQSMGQAIDNPDDAKQILAEAAKSGAGMGAIFGAMSRFMPEASVSQFLGRAVGNNVALNMLNGTSPTDNRPLEDRVFDAAVNTFFSIHGAGGTARSQLDQLAKNIKYAQFNTHQAAIDALNPDGAQMRKITEAPDLDTAIAAAKDATNVEHKTVLQILQGIKQLPEVKNVSGISEANAPSGNAGGTEGRGDNGAPTNDDLNGGGQHATGDILARGAGGIQGSAEEPQPVLGRGAELHPAERTGEPQGTEELPAADTQAALERRNQPERDAMYGLAKGLAERVGSIGISKLRRYYPQFNEMTAARVIKQLEDDGVVGAQNIKNGSHDFIGEQNAIHKPEAGEVVKQPNGESENGGSEGGGIQRGQQGNEVAESNGYAVKPAENNKTAPSITVRPDKRIDVTGSTPEQLKGARDSLGIKGAIIGNSGNAIFPKGTDLAALKKAFGMAEEPKPKRAFIAAQSLIPRLRQLGGVNIEHMKDITGESDVRKTGAVGVFSKNGRGLDDLATTLADEGFPIDTSDVDGGVQQLRDHINDALAGHPVLTHSAQDAQLSADQEAEHRDSIRREAKELGINMVGRKFSDVESEVLNATKEKDSNTYADLSDKDAQKVDDLMLKLQNAIGEDGTEKIFSEVTKAYKDKSAQEYYDELANRFTEALNEHEKSNADRGAQTGAGENAAHGEDFQLQSQSNAEAIAQELKTAKTAREAEAKVAADQEVGDFALTGSNREADVAAAHGQQDLLAKPAQESTAPIADFGEKIEGARKDLAAAMKKEYSDDDIASLPLSKIWPADLSDKIEDPYVAAIAFAARQELPSRPRVAYKVARWVEQVKTLRSLASMMIGSDTVRAKAEALLNENKALQVFKAKVSLLESIDRSQWGRIGSVGEFPNAYRYEPDGENKSKEVPSPTVKVQIDGRTEYYPGAKSVADVIDKVNEKLGVAPKEVKMKFEVRGRGESYFINKAGDSEYRHLMEFKTSKEALDYRNSHYDDLVKAWDGVKERDNVKETDVRGAENRPRTAQDWRKGKDVSTEQFSEQFGFRGGQFGNWVSQGKNIKERQGMLNGAYDALMDLSDILGIPPKALSLNGDLGMSFGARGSGSASAHYESDNLVINLTKTRGSGTLAHEWFHALDNYFQRNRNAPMDHTNQTRFITYKPEPMFVRKDGKGTPMTRAQLETLQKSRPDVAIYDQQYWKPDPNHPQGVRPEVEEKFAGLVQALNDSPMTKRASIIDAGKAEGYWSRIIERAARSFENYIIAKMAEKGYNNDYLANVVDISNFKRDEGRYPYLKQEELAPVVEAFDNLFGEMQTKETDKGTALFSRTNDQDEQVHRLLDAHAGEKDYTREDAIHDYTSGKRLDANGKEYEAMYSRETDKADAAVRKILAHTPDSLKQTLLDVHEGKDKEALQAMMDAGKVKVITAEQGRGIVGDKLFAKTTDQNVYWHGSASGDLRGGNTGLHLGTRLAAKQALEARIGIPATGEWDGTREYGKTLLAGEDTLDRIHRETNSFPKSGLNAGEPGNPVPKEDYYPRKVLKYADGTDMPMDIKPNILPYKLDTEMSNTAYTPRPDWHANGYMRRQIKLGNAKSGYYYKNEGEDAGSISVVVPNGKHVVEVKYSKDGKAQAFYNPSDATTYFIADNLPKDTSTAELRGLVRHEIAVHALNLGRDSTEFKGILKQLDILKGAGNKAVKEAFARVPEGTAPEHVAEESLAYLVQYHPELSLTKRVIAWFRNAIRSILPKGKLSDWANSLTTDDLQYMAQTALAKSYQAERQPIGEGVMASKPHEAFYSQLKVAMRDAPDKIFGNAKSISDWLNANASKLGIKKAEIEATGLDDWLKLQGKVTKADVQNFLDQNGVQVKDVTLGGFRNEWEILDENTGKRIGNTYASEREARNAANSSPVGENPIVNQLPSKETSGGTKFASYQLPGGPLSRDTEILTHEGWKRIDAVEIGEDVLTRRDDDAGLEWSEVEAKPEIYAEKLYHFASQSINMRVTACHKMVVKRRRRSQAGIFRVTAQELWDMAECVVPLTGKWQGNAADTIYDLPAKDVAELIGWYIAEGSPTVSPTGHKSTLAIAQSRKANSAKCTRIEALIDRLGFKWNYSGEQYYLSIKTMPRGLVEMLHAQGKSGEKYVPGFMFDFSPDILQSLLDGLLLGDGCLAKQEKRKPRWTYFTNSRQLADDVQVLALLTGKRGTVKQRPNGLYAVGINSKEWAGIDDAKHAIVDYNDTAYCVTVKNHSIYVRANGVAAFTGNSNYKELLLTLLAKPKLPWMDAPEIKKAQDALYNEFPDAKNIVMYRPSRGESARYNQLYDELVNAIHNAENKKDQEQGRFISSHFDQPNILAHIRFNERTDAEGAKVLFIEEIQSDWGQQAKKNGFLRDPKPIEKVIQEKYGRKLPEDVYDWSAKKLESAGVDSALIADWSDSLKKSGRVLSAPMVGDTKAWTSLALKRMIRYAAENGFDKIAWTTGEQQAARYDLSKQVELVRAEHTNKQGVFDLTFWDKGGKQFDIGLIPSEMLADHVGKDLAEKIVKQPLNKSEDYTGLDLKVGGEGMKGYYDQIVPQVANDILKKLGGGKVEDISVSPKKAGEPNIEKLSNLKQQGFTITPELRNKVMNEGMPLFSKTADKLKEHEAIKAATDSASEAWDGIKRAFAPQYRSPEAMEVARQLTEHLGEKEMADIRFKQKLNDAIKEDDGATTMAERARDMLEKGLTVAADKTFLRMSPEENHAFMQAMDVGDTKYFEAHPELKGMADVIDKMFTDKAEQIQRLGTGVMQEIRENYFPHIWDREPTGDKLKQIYMGLSKRPLEGTKAFSKHRVFDDVNAGLEAGYKPISDNPLDLVALKMVEMDRYIAAHQTLKGMEDANNGALLLLKAGDKGPQGYSDINKYSFITRDLGHGPEKLRYVVRDDVAQVLNNYLSASLYHNRYIGKPFTGYMKAANTLNQFQLGVFSAFHAGFTSMEAVISHAALGVKSLSEGNFAGAGHYFATAPAAWITNPRMGGKIMEEMLKPGSHPEMAQIIQGLQMAGFRWQMDNRFRTDSTKQMIEAWNKGNKLTAGLRSIGAVVEQSARPILEWLVPRQKFGVFGELMNKWIKENPDASHEEMRNSAQQIWNRVDSRLGQVVYDRLFMHNVTKNMLQMLIRAPGWTGGTILEVGGGMTDLAKYAAAVVQGKKPPGLTDRSAYTLSMLTVTALTNAVLTAAFTGESPQDWRDLVAFRSGNLDEYGRPERFMLPTYMKDVYAYSQAPAMTLVHKSHPLLSLGAELINNKDYYGTQIRSEDSNLLTQLAQSAGHVAKAFTPFWMRGVAKEQERGGTLLSEMAPQIGVMPAPSSLNKTDAEKLASKFAADRLPQGSRTQEQTDQADAKRSLYVALRKGDTAKAQELFKQGEADHVLTAKDYWAAVKKSTKDPLVNSFKNLTYDQAVQVYDAATDDEKKKLRLPFIEKKFQNIRHQAALGISAE